MAAYNEDDYCVAQGGERYNAKRLGMMYLLIKTWALLYGFGSFLSMLLTNRLTVTYTLTNKRTVTRILTNRLTVTMTSIKGPTVSLTNGPICLA